MEPFLETLNYSSSNEDSRSEKRALNIEYGDSLLCITGSGGRVLDLLIEQPARIVAIDFNPCQGFLLELKCAAIQHLEYEEFLGLLGVNPFAGRGHIYQSIRQSLSTEARDYWDSHSTMVEKGVIYQGRWESHFRLLAQIIHFARPHRLDRLFNCSEINEQSRVWREEWDNTLWQLFLRSITSRAVWKYMLRDPGFYRYVPGGFSINSYLDKRLTSAFENNLVGRSPFASLLFFGKYSVHGPLPPHLQRDHFKTLKDSLPRITIVSQSLLDYLEQNEKTRFHKYSLSDFSSYTGLEEYDLIWKGIVRTAVEGAKICERQFLVKREIPLDVRPCFIRNKRLEEQLALTDDSIFYSFVAVRFEGKSCDKH
jgi:S-adenosylmethionine-diacylglycerol 3-amino-3-carboxypropyl transferase